MSETTSQVTKYARPDGGVVVGDDGSDGAKAAIRYALEEAHRRGVTLHVLRAWSIMSTPPPGDVPPGIVPSLGEYEATARAEELARVEKMLGDQSDVPVEVHCVHSPAVQALLVAAETADVLVVGSRGLGGFRALVLGSVAEQVIRHARSPVVVVRDPA